MNKVWQQIVYYDSGVRSGSLPSILKAKEPGDGLVVNVLEAYNFASNNYSPGDRIYSFSFSRRMVQRDKNYMCVYKHSVARSTFSDQGGALLPFHNEHES
jgi:hypothetical protein